MVEFLKKISSRLGGPTSEEDIEDYLETLGVEEEHFEEEADMWVKPFIIDSTDTVNSVIEAVGSGAIALVNIEPMYKRNKVKLKQILDKIKKYVEDLNGDIVRVSEYKVLITPRGVKVYRGKGKQ